MRIRTIQEIQSFAELLDEDEYKDKYVAVDDIIAHCKKRIDRNCNVLSDSFKQGLYRAWNDVINQLEGDKDGL